MSINIHITIVTIYIYDTHKYKLYTLVHNSIVPIGMCKLVLF